jgi:hypothetical protein
MDFKDNNINFMIPEANNQNTFQFPISYFQYHRTLAVPNVGLWNFVWWATLDMWLVLIIPFWCNVMTLQLCAAFFWWHQLQLNVLNVTKIDHKHTYWLCTNRMEHIVCQKLETSWWCEILRLCLTVNTGRHYELTCKYQSIITLYF